MALAQAREIDAILVTPSCRAGGGAPKTSCRPLTTCTVMPPSGLCRTLSRYGGTLAL